MEILLSFAEEREDIILYHLLKKVTASTRYVDVGANDPIDISVTKFFYDRGGSGINIEPQQKYIDRLNRDRPRDINLAVGISDEAGELTLSGDDGLATFDCDSEFFHQKSAYAVSVITLSDVFNKYISEDEDIHFLKLDVEGWERECLKGMDFVRFRPWILCIESQQPGTSIPCHEKWEELVLGQNYVLLGESGVNRYYAAMERLNELQEFHQAKELDDIYKIISYETYNKYLKTYNKYLPYMTKRGKYKKTLAKSAMAMSAFIGRVPLVRTVKSSFIWREAYETFWSNLDKM